MDPLTFDEQRYAALRDEALRGGDDPFGGLAVLADYLIEVGEAEGAALREALSDPLLDALGVERCEAAGRAFDVVVFHYRPFAEVIRLAPGQRAPEAELVLLPPLRSGSELTIRGGRYELEPFLIARACVTRRLREALPQEDGDTRPWPEGRASYAPLEPWVPWGGRNTLQRWALARGLAPPTAAQWLFAARAGGERSFWSGTGPPADAPPDTGVAEVGSTSMSPYGLYEVHGNVWEVVDDPRRELSAAGKLGGRGHRMDGDGRHVDAPLVGLRPVRAIPPWLPLHTIITGSYPRSLASAAWARLEEHGVAALPALERLFGVPDTRDRARGLLEGLGQAAAPVWVRALTRARLRGEAEPWIREQLQDADALLPLLGLEDAGLRGLGAELIAAVAARVGAPPSERAQAALSLLERGDVQAARRGVPKVLSTRAAATQLAEPEPLYRPRTWQENARELAGCAGCLVLPLAGVLVAEPGLAVVLAGALGLWLTWTLLRIAWGWWWPQAE